MKEDIERRFVFDPPLDQNYIQRTIQEELNSCCRQWRRYWINTGRGQRHNLCPIEHIPALLKHWKKLDAEEATKAQALDELSKDDGSFEKETLLLLGCNIDDRDAIDTEFSVRSFVLLF